MYQHDDTSGLPYIDHRFTSLAHMPPEFQAWYSEKLVFVCCAWVDEDVTKVIAQTSDWPFNLRFTASEMAASSQLVAAQRVAPVM
jgi:hypothetical protein